MRKSIFKPKISIILAFCLTFGLMILPSILPENVVAEIIQHDHVYWPSSGGVISLEDTDGNPGTPVVATTGGMHHRRILIGTDIDGGSDANTVDSWGVGSYNTSDFYDADTSRQGYLVGGGFTNIVSGGIAHYDYWTNVKRTTEIAEDLNYGALEPVGYMPGQMDASESAGLLSTEFYSHSDDYIVNGGVKIQMRIMQPNEDTKWYRNAINFSVTTEFPYSGFPNPSNPWGVNWTNITQIPRHLNDRGIEEEWIYCVIPLNITIANIYSYRFQIMMQMTENTTHNYIDYFGIEFDWRKTDYQLFIPDKSDIMEGMIWLIIVFLPAILLSNIAPNVGFSAGAIVMLIVLIATEPTFIPYAILSMVAIGVLNYKGG